MNYFYEAVDSEGRSVLGRRDATNEEEVALWLQVQGYSPTAIAPNSPASVAPQPAPSNALAPYTNAVPSIVPQTSVQQVPVPASPRVATQQTFHSSGSNIILAGNAARGNTSTQSNQSSQSADVSSLGGVNDKERMYFFQQFHSLIKSGFTLYAALENLGSRTKNANLAKTIQEMAEATRTGQPISDVMARYPKIYQEHIVAFIRTGELGGFLEIALEEIARIYELNHQLFQHTWLPKLMANAALFGLALIIPLFPALFKGLAALNIVVFITSYLFMVALSIGGAIGLKVLSKMVWLWMQHPSQRRLRDKITLKMPPFGDLHRQSSLYAFITSLRRLYHAEVPPIQTWEAATNTCSNVIIREKLSNSAVLMSRGASLPDAFAATGLFNNDAEQTIATGHLSGEVVVALDRIAAYYKDRIDEARRMSRFMMFRMGLLLFLVLGGATICWGVYSYFNGVLSVDKLLFPELEQ